MQADLIEIAKVTTNLIRRPIEPSWIIEGNPESSSSILSTSADGLAMTIVWECSEGKFDWFYDLDETIMILEGSIVLQSEGMQPTRYTAGDVIFFKDGAHARWHVEGYVKKIAFCRKTSPFLFGLALRVFLRLRRMFLPVGTHKPAGLVPG